MNNNISLAYSEEARCLYEEIRFEGEHFNNGILLNNCDWELKILPVTRILLPDEGIYSPLPKYHYCPDQRLYTFRLLGKDSPGLPPPFVN